MPGLDVRVTDGAQQNGVEPSQFLQRAGWQNFTGAQIAVAAQVVVGQLQFEPFLVSNSFYGLDGFPDYFRSSAVPGEYGNPIASV